MNNTLLLDLYVD